ncbi:MAG TPA: hypothetical protein PKK07_03085, partial [bacterium]|nr:hypothetical protein [bacterium]
NIIKEHGFSICNVSVLAEIEKKLSDKLGLDIRLGIRESIVLGKGYPSEYILIVSCEKIKYLKEFPIEINVIKFPTIRRVAAKTISQDLVSVKPMSAPISKNRTNEF